MTMNSEAIEHIAARTLAHYERRADEFWQGTRDHDVSQNIAALQHYIEAPPPFELLDFGCDPGRDLKTGGMVAEFLEGLEGAARLATMARAYSGCDVLQQNFLELNLPAAHFDGVFANAVLFHVPRQALPRVLKELQATLKPGGVLFSSNPRGDGREGWSGERYGTFHDWQAWRTYLSAAGFVELTYYYRPAGLPLEQQPWLASVWRKPTTGMKLS